jgi:16S rRNA processing protein RimM/ribosomal protein S16
VATTIRLQRTGRKRQASFRIVVTDVNEQRDGPAIETLGTYNPRTQPSIVRLDAAASLNWLYEGAQPTDTVVSIFRKTGVWQKFQAGETADSLEETVVTLGPPPGEQKTSTRAAVAAEAQKLRAVEVAAARQVADEAAKQAAKEAAAEAKAAAAEAAAAEAEEAVEEAAEEVEEVAAEAEEAVEEAAEEVEEVAAEAEEVAEEEVAAEAEEAVGGGEEEAGQEEGQEEGLTRRPGGSMDEIVVGLVRNAHGLDGEVLVELLTGDPDDVFVEGRVFRISGRGRRGPDRLTLTGARRHKGGLLLSFGEIEDRTAAERLRGCELALPGDDLRKLEEDEFFLHDLVGYTVVCLNGEPVGDVVTSYETGAQLLLGVLAGKRELLIPFGRQLVTEVDREGRRIVIDPPPGLLEV